MSEVEFPRAQLVVLQQLGARLLDGRKTGTENEALARNLLAGVFDLCMRAGLDRVVVELERAYPPHPISDAAALADHPDLLPALVAQLGTIELDDGGPRNAKLRQLADCVVAALGLAPADEPDRTITLDDAVRTEVVAALASVIDVELAAPHLRDTIIATARARCDASMLSAFGKIAAQLDEQGLRMIKEPKVPLHVSQAVQQALVDARHALIERMAGAAIDRATPVIARANAEAAARLELPITHRLTPRDVAILRVRDARVPKVPVAVVQSLLDSLTEASRLAWRAPERPVRPYSASQTFAVGELIEHPKFGRGSVISRKAQRIDVEFADGKRTLVHVPPPT